MPSSDTTEVGDGMLSGEGDVGDAIDEGTPLGVGGSCTGACSACSREVPPSAGEPSDGEGHGGVALESVSCSPSDSTRSSSSSSSGSAAPPRPVCGVGGRLAFSALPDSSTSCASAATSRSTSAKSKSAVVVACRRVPADGVAARELVADAAALRRRRGSVCLTNARCDWKALRDASRKRNAWKTCTQSCNCRKGQSSMWEQVHPGTHLEDLVLDLDTRERSFVRKQRDLVAQHLGIASLDEQRWQALELAKERRDVRVREILVDRIAEQALDRVEVVVLATWARQVIVGLRARTLARERAEAR